MKSISKLTQSLLGLTLLVGCAPQLPGGPGPLAGFPRGATSVGRFNAPINAAAAVNDPLLMTDNFNAWIKLKQRSEGFEGDAPSVPVEGETVAQLPTAAPKALTYLTYEALDNNLYQDLNRILDTLELVGSNPQMNLLAQTDNFGPGNAARYLIKQHPQFGEIVSPHVKLGDAAENTGDPRVLADSVKWGFSGYPAKMNWLNISTHGMGFAGISTDDNPEASMNIINFNQAVRAGLSGKKLDILSFDACLMAMVEVGSELKDTANIMVASEDSTYYWGYGYYQTFSKIAANPAAMNPDQVVRSMVVDVNNKGASNQTLTISATDLRKIGELEAELDKLARALRRLMPTQAANIIRAAASSRDFHLAAGIPFRDINRLGALLKQNVKDAEVAQIVDRINHVLYRRGVIMFSRQSKLQNDQGRGLAIYLPTEGKVSGLYRQTRFAKTTQWDEFLLDLNAAINKAAGVAG